MFAAPLTQISSPASKERTQRKPGELFQPSLYTSASCMDFRQRREDDGRRPPRRNQQLQPTPYQQQQRPAQQPHSSPLPQTQWTDVPPVYRPRNWVDPEELSPVMTRQTTQSSRPDPMSAWRVRPQPQHQSTAPTTSRQETERPKRRKSPRIFRRQDTADSNEQPQQPFDVTMLYPQMSPYDPSRMSTYSAPEHLEHSQYGSLSQPSTPSFAPTGFSALPSRSDEPSPIGIPRSPTYPPAGRGRMHSAAGLGDAAFEDEQDFRLFVEATAGLPPDVGGFSPTQQQSQSPRRRATTEGRRQSSVPAIGVSEVSPVAETPTTMFALQQLASIPQANQTYRPQTQTQTQSQPSYRAYQPQRSVSQQQQPTTKQETRPQRPEAHRTESAANRERLAASASGLDLWLPSPVSPQTATTPTQNVPRRAVGSSTARAASVSSHYSGISPLTPEGPRNRPYQPPISHLQPHAPQTSAPPPPPPAFIDLDDEITRQLEELELEEEGAGAEGREYDDELPDYAQSQAEAQAERRAEAARRARELQERWLRRGR